MTTRRTFEQGSQERLGWGPARTRVAAGTSVRVSLSARKALRLGWGRWGCRGPVPEASAAGRVTAPSSSGPGASADTRLRGQTSGDSTGRPGQGCGVKSQQLRGQPAGTFPGSGDQAPERHARASGPRLIRGGTKRPRCQAAGAWASDPEGRPVGSRPLPGRHRARSGGGRSSCDREDNASGPSPRAWVLEQPRLVREVRARQPRGRPRPPRSARVWSHFLSFPGRWRDPG